MKGAIAFPLRVITLFSHYYAVFSSTHFGSNFFVSLETLGDVPLHGASVYNVISEEPWHSHQCWTPFSHHVLCIFFLYAFWYWCLFGFFSPLRIYKFTHMETSPLHGASVYNVISQDPWHSHLLLSVGQWSCNNLFLRLILVCRDWIRTPNLACGANALTHCANAASLVLIGLIMINLSA